MTSEILSGIHRASKQTITMATEDLNESLTQRDQIPIKKQNKYRFQAYMKYATR